MLVVASTLYQAVHGPFLGGAVMVKDFEFL